MKLCPFRLHSAAINKEWENTRKCCEEEECAMWRTMNGNTSVLEIAEEDQIIGYCGLAGKPEQI